MTAIKRPTMRTVAEQGHVKIVERVSAVRTRYIVGRCRETDDLQLAFDWFRMMVLDQEVSDAEKNVGNNPMEIPKEEQD